MIADLLRYVNSIEAAEKAVAATVDILTEWSTGSGFIVHPEGLVVTARHVVQNEEGRSERLVKIHLADGSEKDGVVFRSHRQLDFALVWIMEKAYFPTIVIDRPQELRFGELLLTVGSPSGLSKTVSQGIVSNPKQHYRHIECIQTDAAISYGNSGGPLVSTSGAVGIMVWGFEDPSTGRDVGNANFAIPIDYLLEDIDTAIAIGKEKCLKATYCIACGFLDPLERIRYCRNCGIELPQPTKRKKPQSLPEILAACDAHSRKIFKFILKSWENLGFLIQPGTGGISLKALAKGKPIGLASLRANLPNLPAFIVIGWESFRRGGIFPDSAVSQFQRNTSQLFKLKITASSAHIMVQEDFDEQKASRLIEELAHLAEAAKELDPNYGKNSLPEK